MTTTTTTTAAARHLAQYERYLESLPDATRKLMYTELAAERTRLQRAAEAAEAEQAAKDAQRASVCMTIKQKWGVQTDDYSAVMQAVTEPDTIAEAAAVAYGDCDLDGSDTSHEAQLRDAGYGSGGAY